MVHPLIMQIKLFLKNSLMVMPVRSIIAADRVLREQYSISELPVLLLTARNQPADIYTGFSSGANDYVSKPIDALELKYRIRALTMLKQSINERLRLEAAYLQAQLKLTIKMTHKLATICTSFLL